MFAAKTTEVGDWVQDGMDGDDYAGGDGEAGEYELNDEEERDENEAEDVGGDNEGNHDDGEEEEGAEDDGGEDDDGDDDDDDNEYGEDDGDYDQEHHQEPGEPSDGHEDNGSSGQSDVENWYAQVTAASQQRKFARRIACIAHASNAAHTRASCDSRCANTKPLAATPQCSHTSLVPPGCARLLEAAPAAATALQCSRRPSS